MQVKRIITELVDTSRGPMAPGEVREHPFLRITALENEIFTPGGNGIQARITLPGAELTPGAAQEIGMVITKLLRYEEPKEKQDVEHSTHK